MMGLTLVWILPAQTLWIPGKFLSQPKEFPKIPPACDIGLRGFIYNILCTAAMARALPPISVELLFPPLDTKSTAQAQA